MQPGGINDYYTSPASSCATFSEDGDNPLHSSFVYLRANHKSVLGIGAYAKERGAAISCVDEAGVQNWLKSPASSGEHQQTVLTCLIS